MKHPRRVRQCITWSHRVSVSLGNQRNDDAADDNRYHSEDMTPGAE